MKLRYFIDYSKPCRTTAAAADPDTADWFIDHGYTEVSKLEYMTQYRNNEEDKK